MTYRVENIPEIGSAEEFRRHVLEAPGAVAVVFGADWCPDCRRFAPTFTALARRYADRAAFYRVSTSRCGDLEARWNVGLIPTVLLFRDGALERTWEFVEDPAAYTAALEALPPRRP